MTHDEYRELLSLHALDAIETPDRHVLESHLEACPSCSAELAELRDITADLTFLAAPIAPRPGDLERLFATLDAGPDRAGAHRPAVRARRKWRSRVFAAVAVAAIVTLTVSHWRLLGRLDEGYSEIDRLRKIGRFVSSPNVSVVGLWGAEAARGAYAKLAYDRTTGRFVLLSSGLPGVPAGRRYQLWVIAERIHPAGAFLPEAPNGLLLAPPRADLFFFAVSVEPFGDVDEPTGDLVLMSGPLRNP